MLWGPLEDPTDTGVVLIQSTDRSLGFNSSQQCKYCCEPAVTTSHVYILILIRGDLHVYVQSGLLYNDVYVSVLCMYARTPRCTLCVVGHITLSMVSPLMTL
jgi:hypothetical protein